MMFTGLAYQEIGNWVASIFIFMFIVVVIYRYIMAFRYYVYNGNFCNYEESTLYAMMDGEFIDSIKYAFVGYHPGMIIADALVFVMFSMLMIIVWLPVTFISLFLLLGYTMRRRIARKQEFIAKLEGTRQ